MEFKVVLCVLAMAVISNSEAQVHDQLTPVTQPPVVAPQMHYPAPGYQSPNTAPGYGYQPAAPARADELHYNRAYGPRPNYHHDPYYNHGSDSKASSEENRHRYGQSSSFFGKLKKWFS